MSTRCAIAGPTRRTVIRIGRRDVEGMGWSRRAAERRSGGPEEKGGHGGWEAVLFNLPEPRRPVGSFSRISGNAQLPTPLCPIQPAIRPYLTNMVGLVRFGLPSGKNARFSCFFTTDSDPDDRDRRRSPPADLSALCRRHGPAGIGAVRAGVGRVGVV